MYWLRRTFRQAEANLLRTRPHLDEGDLFDVFFYAMVAHHEVLSARIKQYSASKAAVHGEANRSID
jgi:hypothetical protein